MEPAERQRMEELQRRKNAREAPGYNEKIRLGRIEDSKKEMAERFARAFDLEILYRVSEEKRGGDYALVFPDLLPSTLVSLRKSVVLALSISLLGLVSFYVLKGELPSPELNLENLRFLGVVFPLLMYNSHLGGRRQLIKIRKAHRKFESNENLNERVQKWFKGVCDKEPPAKKSSILFWP